MSKKLNKEELLTLESYCNPSKLRGAGEAWGYACQIPKLVREILELRKENEQLKEEIRDLERDMAGEDL